MYMCVYYSVDSCIYSNTWHNFSSVGPATQWYMRQLRAGVLESTCHNDVKLLFSIEVKQHIPQEHENAHAVVAIGRVIRHQVIPIG